MEWLRRELDRHGHDANAQVGGECTDDDLGRGADEIGMSDDDRSYDGAPDAGHDVAPNTDLLEEPIELERKLDVAERGDREVTLGGVLLPAELRADARVIVPHE